MPDPVNLTQLQDMVVRHRMTEAAAFAEGAARALRDVALIAGSVNGATSAAEARANEAKALAQTIQANLDAIRRPSAVQITERMSDEARRSIGGGQASDAPTEVPA